MWKDIFIFLWQEGIMGRLCKQATHRARVIGDDKGKHADVFEMTGSVWRTNLHIKVLHITYTEEVSFSCFLAISTTRFPCNLVQS